MASESSIPKLVGSVLLCEAAGGVGSIFTYEAVSATFLKYGTQKCASDASAVSAVDPIPRVLLDG